MVCVQGERNSIFAINILLLVPLLSFRVEGRSTYSPLVLRKVDLCMRRSRGNINIINV